MGALWKSEMKDGKEMLSGHVIFGGMKVRIAAFPVKEKKGKMPDFNIVVSKKPKG